MAAAKQNKGSWGGFLFVAFIAACAYAPALAGVVVVGGIIWLIFASNAKFKIGNNPGLMQTGQRGHVDVVIATRSQVRSKSGNGPWQHTWTIALDAQPPHSAGYRIVAYRKLPERAGGPSQGQRYAAWFDKTNPQSFHVDWNAFSGASGQSQVQPQARAEESASVKRAQAYTQAHAKPQNSMQGQASASVKRVQASAQARANDQPYRPAPPASYLPLDTNEPPPLVEADGGWDFDFIARGIDGRARIEDFAENTEDGSTELALTVMPRGGLAAYRTVVTTYVPYDRKFQIAKGLSVRVKVDPRMPGRLMIVS